MAMNPINCDGCGKRLTEEPHVRFRENVPEYLCRECWRLTGHAD